MHLEHAFALQAEVVSALSPRPRLGPRAFALRALGKAPPAPPAEGIAVGVTAAEGGDDYRLAVRVQRRDLIESETVRHIVDTAGGEAEVRYVGRLVRRQDPTARTRPLRIGLSVALAEGAAGTLGCFVRSSNDDAGVEILSNNHVLADENRAKIGDHVIQPAGWDSGESPADVVAQLTRYEPLRLSGINRVDCATAALVDGVEHDALALLAGATPLDPRPYEPRTGILVEKIGRSTGRTVGRVSGLNVSILGIEYDSDENVRFDGQLEIEDVGGTPFSAVGDSGALIFTKDERRPVGLLFGGDDGDDPDSPGVTYANPIATVLETLKLTLVT